MRDLLEELAKGFLNGGKVGVDVGVVEFHIIENDQFGKVLEKLASFIGKGCVVLIPLQHPEGACSVVASCRKVEGNSSDKPARVKARFFEQKGQHRRSGCFSMGA